MKAHYKQTDVGLIPEDWDADGIGRFWTVTDCKHVTAHFVSSGYPLASIKEVQNRFVSLAGAKQTTLHFYNLLVEGGRKPRTGDLILSRNATVGEVAQVAEWHPPFAMGQDVCLLRKKYSDLSTNYLQALFRSPTVERQISDSMVGSTFKRINVQQIRNFVVPMPGQLEQDAIGDALSDVDALIESLEQLLGKKRHLKQGAMQELITGKKRLPGFSEKWKLKSLAEVAPLQRGFDLPNGLLRQGTYPVVYSNGVLTHHASYRVKGPGVVTGRSGTIGSVTFVEQDFWPHNTSLWVTSFKGNDPKFIFYLYKKIGFERFATGSGVPTLNRNDVHAYKALIPLSRSEQAAIATILSDMDAELSALEAKLTKARQIKQGMMQELLTGRIRLV